MDDGGIKLAFDLDLIFPKRSETETTSELFKVCAVSKSRDQRFLNHFTMLKYFLASVKLFVVKNRFTQSVVNYVVSKC